MSAGFVVIAVVIVAAATGAVSVAGSPFLAIPIVVVGLIASGIYVVLRRPEKLQDEPEEIEFTERDRETLIPGPDAGSGPPHAGEAARRARHR